MPGIQILISVAGSGNVINAASASRTDVSNAIDSAVNGDIIHIPAGTATWATPISVTKNITIRGAGTTSPLTQLINSSTAGQGLETPIFDIDPAVDNPIRISQIYFQDQGTNRNSDGIRIGNASSVHPTQVRIDHCTFEGFSFAVKNLGSFGVCDHCYFLNNKIAARNRGYANSGDLKGISGPPWGWDLSKYLVYEDNTFELASWTLDINTMDTEFPDSYMVRHCTFNYNRAGAFVADGFDMHGNAGTAINPLGLVVYSNTFNYTGNNTVNPCRLTDIRGGRYSLAYDNVVNGVNSYATLRSDPSGSVDMTDTYLWNNLGDSSSAMAFDVQSGLVENTNYFKSTPVGFTGFTYPHPLAT